MADQNIDIAIRARNQASAPIRAVKADLASLEKAGGGGVDLGGMLGGALAGGALAFGLAGVVDMATQAGAAIFDLSKQAASVATLRAAFDDLAAGVGQSGEQMIAAMRNASGGMIADADLMLSANKAMMLGVADSAAEMAQLLEVAAVRGKAMGLSTGQAFSDLVTGIGRMSPLILDNLGIVTGGEKVFADYAASLGRTAASLSDVERKQALLNKVIAETDTSSLPIVNQFERMDAAISNAKVALGELFAPSVAAIAQQIADATIAATTAMQANAAAQPAEQQARMYESLLAQLTAARAELEQYNQVAGQTDDLTAKMAANMGTFGAPSAGEDAGKIKARIAALEQEILALDGVQIATAATKDAAWDAAIGWDKFTASSNAAGAAAANAGPDLQQLASSLGVVGAMALNAATDLASFNAAVNRIQAGFAAADRVQGLRQTAISAAQASAQRAVDAGADPAQVAAQLGEVTDKIWNMAGPTEQTTESMFLFQQTLTGAGQALDDQASSMEAANKAATKLASGGVAQVSQAYSDLQSKVASVLSGSLDAGVSAADLLPREDDINENARRLADIAVNGLKGQDWLGEFQAEAPQAWSEIMAQVADGVDAKTAAARILRDFEDGLRPDLIDKDAAKERVKRMILGEQSMAALAEEIAQELATEMGIPLQQAMAAAGGALGVTTGAAGEAAADATGAEATDMTSSGASAGASFMAGFAANADGTLIVAGIVAKMTAELPKFRDQGATAGTQWGSGFMGTVETGIAQPLISLLATLVTPAVMAAILGGQSQTTPP